MATRASAPRAALERWHALALGDRVDDALVVLDDDAAASARSHGARASWMHARAACSLRLDDFERDADSTRDARDASGATVREDAPVVVFVGARLDAARRGIEACARARRRARRFSVFCGCDEGDETASEVAVTLAETCERILGDGRLAVGGSVEGAGGVGREETGEADGDGDDASEDWGSWGDGSEDDDAKVVDSTEGGASSVNARGARAEPSARGDRGGVFSIKFFPPLMYRALGDGAFALSRARVEGIGRDVADALTGESRFHRVVGHHLAEIAAHWALLPDYFALGPNAEAVSRVAAQAKTDPVGVDATVKPRSAAVIVVDREIDLMTPSASRDAWLERVLDEDGGDALTQLTSLLCPLASDPTTSALDEALCAKTANDGANYIKKLLREAVRSESIDAPAEDAKSRGVSAADILSLVSALETDPSVGLRHRALIQRAKLTAAGLTSEKEMKANRQIIALQRLTSAALEGGAASVCATVVEILKMLYSTGGTAAGHVREAAALVLASYVIATESNACSGVAATGTTPFAARDEAALRDAFLGALIASDGESVRESLPSLTPTALKAMDLIRARGAGAETSANAESEAAEDDWGNDDDWGDDDEWGASPTPPSKASSATATSSIDDPELAAAFAESRSAIERALERVARIASAGRASLKHPRGESKSLYANGLPNPTLLDLVARVKSATDDQGVCADFVHIAASLGGLFKRAAATASASIVTGAMGRLGALIDKVTAAPKPSDRECVVVFVLGACSPGELSAFLAERRPGAAAALNRRDAQREFILGFCDVRLAGSIIA